MKDIRIVRATVNGSPSIFLCKPLRELELKPGDFVVVEVVNNKIVIRKARPEDMQ